MNSFAKSLMLEYQRGRWVGASITVEMVMQLGENGVPELRLLGLMGIWGSAFCATLSH